MIFIQLVTNEPSPAAAAVAASATPTSKTRHLVRTAEKKTSSHFDFCITASTLADVKELQPQRYTPPLPFHSAVCRSCVSAVGC